ncbi:helix-turn-helix domain-containing protein [Alteribacillus sp. HJP-4]|uniref:helix-turn-helix domain-containing protein n=1 Tax=Alteribacillus sp. HJP-4 TaxID=2775394 RepID=UPI0035CD0492
MEEPLYSRRLRSFRKLKGFTQVSLAEKMGISVTVLGQVERGSRVPDKVFLDKAARALQISTRDLQS